jgi:hypothetical protein
MDDWGFVLVKVAHPLSRLYDLWYQSPSVGGNGALL